MDVDVDRIGGNLLRGIIALVLWIAAAMIIRFIAIQVISPGWTVVLSYVLGFIVVFVGASYWYYRQSI